MRKKIEFLSEVKNLCLVEKLIDDISTELNISDEIYGKIQVSIIEGVNNAIFHGNKLDGSKMVVLSSFTDDNFLVFTIVDEGTGFNFNRIPDPTSPENIEKPHGRGVFLTKHLSDDLKFFDEGRKIEIKFKLN